MHQAIKIVEMDVVIILMKSRLNVQILHIMQRFKSNNRTLMVAVGWKNWNHTKMRFWQKERKQMNWLSSHLTCHIVLEFISHILLNSGFILFTGVFSWYLCCNFCNQMA